jgi:hypothetical protein
MIVVAMIIDGMIVMRIRSMGIASTHLAVMLDGIAARIARMRAENRDQPGDYSADQWQKHDCLDHRRASLRMISGQAKSFVRENRYPPIGSSEGMLFRIMR